MPHLITIVCAVIAVLALIVFSFKQEEVPAALLQDQQSQPSSEAKLSSDDEKLDQSTAKIDTKDKKISATARAYYKQAAEQGYVSLVPAFESGAIAHSDMSTKEKEKICELTLIHVRVAEIKRLEKTDCYTKNGKIGFRSIHGALKTADGTIDQAAIIEKLKYFHERNQLQTDITYKIPVLGYEEHDSAYNKAVAFDLEQVFDYLSSIDAPLPKNNLLHDHLRGHHPNIPMIKKLQALGYNTDQGSLNIINNAKFQQKHAEVYQYLSQK
jgi:hypothetical protein